MLRSEPPISLWELAGCSYQYNTFLPAIAGKDPTKRPVAAASGLAGQATSWVPNPVLYILMHEPPAKHNYGEYVHWHYCQGQHTLPADQLNQDVQRFVSPVLFVDGHVAFHDFTRSLKTEPQFPYEPTGNWIWYKPAD